MSSLNQRMSHKAVSLGSCKSQIRKALRGIFTRLNRHTELFKYANGMKATRYFRRFGGYATDELDRLIGCKMLAVARPGPWTFTVLQCLSSTETKSEARRKKQVTDTAKRYLQPLSSLLEQFIDF